MRMVVFRGRRVKREEAIRRALRVVPGPFHILEKEAGLPERILERIRDGLASASPEPTEEMASAMDSLVIATTKGPGSAELR